MAVFGPPSYSSNCLATPGMRGLQAYPVLTPRSALFETAVDVKLDVACGPLSGLFFLECGL